MGDKVIKSPLLVNKNDSKKGVIWSDLTNERIIKQHGGHKIPKNDLHAISEFVSPIEKQPDDPKETAATLHDIEKEINQLKETEEKNQPQPVPSAEELEHELFEDEE